MANVNPGPSGALVAAPTLGAGRYTITALLGKGGTARVYQGWDDRLRTWRAIKVLSPQHVDDPAMRRRFMNEARTMARFENAHLIQTVDVIDDADTPFFVMELAEAGSVIDWLKRNGAMSPQRTLEVAVAMLEALAACHAENIIHRDVKPHNVLIDRKGRCKLTDFGIAQLDVSMGMTQTGSQMGTFAYMAPEQRSDAKSVDLRADLYAVGASCFTMLTCKTSADLFVAEADDEVFRGIHPDLVPFVMRSCAYKPGDRFQTAEEMRAGAEALLAALGPERHPSPPLQEHLMPLPTRPATHVDPNGELAELFMGLGRRGRRIDIEDAATTLATPSIPSSKGPVMPYQMSRPTTPTTRSFSQTFSNEVDDLPDYLGESERAAVRAEATAREVTRAHEQAALIRAEEQARLDAAAAEANRGFFDDFDQQALRVVLAMVSLVLLCAVLLGFVATMTASSRVNAAAEQSTLIRDELVVAMQREVDLIDVLTRAGATPELGAAFFAWKDASVRERPALARAYLELLRSETERIDPSGTGLGATRERVGDLLKIGVRWDEEDREWRSQAGGIFGRVATTIGLATSPP